MKNSSKLVLIVLGIILNACQVDPDNAIQDSELDLQTHAIENTAETNDHSDTMRGGGNNNPYNVPEDIGRTLEWTAFMAGAAFYVGENRNLRTWFKNNIAEGDAILLDDLLGNNPPDGGLFATNFDEVLDMALTFQINRNNGTILPGLGDGEPDPPVTPEGDGLITVEILKADYLDYVLNLNCIEIFFPNEFNVDSTDQIATVGHPLDGSYSHLGIERTALTETEHHGVNPNYVMINNNVIVARPVHNPMGALCNYAGYFTTNPVFNDFTIFLEGNGAY